MRRPRKFFSLIIILILINVLFFSFWYAFGGRNLFRNWLTGMVGTLLKAEISMTDLHISDKQIFAQNLHFATKDSLISVDADNIRVSYNLYKLIFSGFKPKGVVGSVEISKPIVALNYTPKPKTRRHKPRRDFKLPDLSGYFRKLTLEDGSFSANIHIPLKIVNRGNLSIEESLSNINLIVNNNKFIDIDLKANTSLGGTISVLGRLDRGRIDRAEADIAGFKPLYITHPDIRDFRSELNLNASYREPADSSAAMYMGKALIWNSTAVLLDKYPVKIPLISAEADGANLSGRLTRSTLGSSDIEADFMLRNIGKRMSFDGSALKANLDLGMILPQLSGMVHAEARANGNIKDPDITLSASSDQMAYANWAFSAIKLDAAFKDHLATLSLDNGVWENQIFSLSGNFDPSLLALKARLDTQPLAEDNVPYFARGGIDVEGLILKPYPMFNVKLDDLDLAYRDARLHHVNGVASMVPLDQSLIVSSSLDTAEGLKLNVSGDLISRHLLLDADFEDIAPGDFITHKLIERYQPLVGAKIKAMMLGNKIWTSSDIALKSTRELLLDSHLSVLGSMDISDLSATAFVNSHDSFFNQQPFALEISAAYADDRVRIHGFKLNDIVNLSGNLNLKNWQDLSFEVAMHDLTTAKLSAYYPDLALMVPDFKGLSLFSTYNRAGDRQLDTWLNIQSVDLISVIPLDLDLRLKGVPEDISILGNVMSKSQELLSLSGSGSVLPQISFALDAAMEDLKLQDVLTQPPGLGRFSGTAGIEITNVLSHTREIEFDADLRANELQFGEFNIDKAVVRAAQQAEALIVDSLWVVAKDLFTATAKGSLGFNVVKNEFFESDRTLNIDVKGQLFPWLKQLTDYIVDSRGVSNISLSVGNDDEQFIVRSGNIDIHSGHIMLKDQVEALRNIELKGIFTDNRFMIQRSTFDMGNGSFYLNNVFDPEPTDHFVLGFLDLGYFRVMIDQPGIQATIPVIAPPKTLSNIALKGQNSRYATVKGPFDDMKIEAYVTASNLDILFPPGADNLLNLILSVRSTGKKPDTDPVPLPFQMDLFVNIGENVRYVTYPTNLSLQPGGFLHLLYDGNAFIVKEVFISSERGTVDFFGTVFQVDNIAISMIDQQDIMNVEGHFYKRTPDGSTVSLNVRSTPEFDKSLLDRLEISLTSDNPADRNITQVLSRLRYNQSMDELPDEQKQNLLQDEALGLIGGNLNSTVLTPIFYPVENWIRRTLALDSFSINAGFIQNLFTEYSSDPSSLADMADLSNLTNDINRFSSSILLNNLSISMSKYLGYRFFVDYELGLQEATDLQKKTRLMVSHDTSLRLVLPKQYRVGYTFSYEPSEERITHEIMIQKTLRFWGL